MGRFLEGRLQVLAVVEWNTPVTIHDLGHGSAHLSEMLVNAIWVTEETIWFDVGTKIWVTAQIIWPIVKTRNWVTAHNIWSNVGTRNWVTVEMVRSEVVGAWIAHASFRKLFTTGHFRLWLVCRGVLSGRACHTAAEGPGRARIEGDAGRPTLVAFWGHPGRRLHGMCAHEVAVCDPAQLNRAGAVLGRMSQKQRRGDLLQCFYPHQASRMKYDRRCWQPGQERR